MFLDIPKSSLNIKKKELVYDNSRWSGIINNKTGVFTKPLLKGNRKPRHCQPIIPVLKLQLKFPQTKKAKEVLAYVSISEMVH